MNAQEEAAWEIHQFLTELQVPYAIIGELPFNFGGNHV